jgi:hypothetical protein
MIDPDHLDRNPILPPVHVEEIIADHKGYTPRDGLRLPPLTRNEGRDSEWQDPGTRRQAFYADLSPGNYRFRVIASNNDGVWNEEGTTLAFSVAAAWYQTWWFRGVSLTVFLALLWCIYRLRVRGIQQRSEQLASINAKLETQIVERSRRKRRSSKRGRISHTRTGSAAWES